MDDGAVRHPARRVNLQTVIVNVDVDLAAVDKMLYNEINAQANRKVCVMLLQHFVNFIGENEEICVFNDGRLISYGKYDKLYDAQQ